MDKNTITGFVLIALVLIGFGWYNQPSAEQIAEAARQDSIAQVERKKAEAQQKQAEAQQTAKAIEEVEQKTGRSIAHYDMRFLKPLDEALLTEVVQKFRCIVTVEDGVRAGGFGSAVLEWVADLDFLRRRRG